MSLRRETAVEEEDEEEVEIEREEENAEEVQACSTRTGPHCFTDLKGMLGGSLLALIK